MRIGIDVRVADPAQPGQQRYLWRLGTWLGAQGHQCHFLSVKPQLEGIETPAATRLERFDGISRTELRRRLDALELDVLLLNPERSRRYRGVSANLLRSAYGTDQYSQKLRSFRQPAALALRKGLRATPWVRAERRWERAFYEDAPTPDVIAQSEYMKAEILDSYRIPADRVHVVHNAIDREEFSTPRRMALRDEMRARWGIPEDTFCLLFLGHNYRLKGLWQVLRVLPRVKAAAPVHLLVVGRGTGRGQRRTAARMLERHGLGQRVTLAGPVRSSIEAHAAADALLHVSWHDSFGFVALEAMACGLPVVTTPYVGASELIQDGVSGLLVEPGDDAALVETIHKLVSGPDGARLGTEAAAVAAAHDEPRNFSQVLATMEVARARSGGPIRT